MRLEKTRAIKANAADVIDLDEAQRFLDLLRPKALRWTFQTFDDDHVRKNKKLARILHGHLDDHADELARLNQDGAGVFVTVNLTDGKGRKRENVKQVRAITLDLDGEPLDPVTQCTLKPHIVVELSPGRYQAHWRGTGLSLDDFEDVQRGLAKRFDGDPAIALLTNVARVPGFYHCKGEPFRTRIVEVNDLPPYSADKIIKEFPPLDTPHKPSGSRADSVVLSVNSPRESATKFLKRVCMIEGAKPPAFCLHFFRGVYYEWAGSQFREVEEAYVAHKLYNFLDDALTVKGHQYVAFNPTTAKVNQILHALKHGVLLPKHEDPPFWIGRKFEHDDDLIACRNGLLDIVTGKLQKHTPYYFNMNSLTFNYDPNALAPKRWQEFLRQLWPEDAQARKTLQEIFGLLLTPDTQYEKIFMVVGPKRSGKGTVSRVLTALLGKENVVNPTLNSLSTNFGLSALIDKRAAIITDARIGAHTDGYVVAERLLSISGEDAQTIDIKYRSHWSGRLGVRFLVLTNELPRITDASGALTSRFVLLMLKNSFYGKEDQRLTDKLVTELPGILNWSLDGLDRLRKRGHFDMPQSSVEAIRMLEDLASPVGAFIRAWCVVGPTERVEVKVLYDAWSLWCEVHGHKPGSDAMFGRNLRAAYPHTAARGHGADRFYQGVGLSKEGEDAYDNARRDRVTHRYS